METIHQLCPNTLTWMSTRHEEVIDIAILLNIRVANNLAAEFDNEGSNHSDSVCPQVNVKVFWSPSLDLL